MKNNRHLIKKVKEDSIADQMGIESGDWLLAVNGQEVEDIFDYQYLIEDEYVELLIGKAGGEEWLLEIDKEEGEDPGLEFENSLMDEYRSCRNKCIFCFIDQLPPGMRKTLYFKDDDSRLSFLQGNYVTLTNMSEHDLDRICRFRMEPVNISFQTTNPDLRCRMLGNRFAGEALKKADVLYDAGIEMNGQIVLCRDVNDGEELKRTITDLERYIPYLKSLSVVPVGLSRYRDGLYPLEPFDRESAAAVIDLIEEAQRRIYKREGYHFVHASDEWYMLAGRPLPEEDRYDGYRQLENGVGMLRLLMEEFAQALEELKENMAANNIPPAREVSLATGLLALPVIEDLAAQLMEAVPGLVIHVYGIENQFFGPLITVSGLLTGGDIIRALSGKEMGETLFLPGNVLRSGERVLLDDVTDEEISRALQVRVDIVKSNGFCFVEKLTGIKPEKV